MCKCLVFSISNIVIIFIALIRLILLICVLTKELYFNLSGSKILGQVHSIIYCISMNENILYIKVKQNG